MSEQGGRRQLRRDGKCSLLEGEDLTCSSRVTGVRSQLRIPVVETLAVPIDPNIAFPQGCTTGDGFRSLQGLENRG